MLRITFTVDEETVTTLKRIAMRLKKPQSAIFREAIKHYSEHADQLSPEERERMLAVVDRMIARGPTRSQADVDTELAHIRAARKTGGRRTRVE
jgi:predicted transcriptional regulator